MKLGYGKGEGVQIDLDGDEVAQAISAWLVAHSVHIVGARTTRVNGQIAKSGSVYVDPAGFVIYEDERLKRIERLTNKEGKA